MISGEVNKIKEDYLSSEISYEEAKKRLNFVEFNILEAKYNNSVLKEPEVIKKDRQALAKAESLFNSKEYDKALKA